MGRPFQGILLGLSLLLGGCFGSTGGDGNPDGGPSGPNQAPSFDLVLPLNDVRVALGAEVQLIYVDDDPDDDALTDLYADIDGDLTTTGDQRTIALARPDKNGLQQDVVWQTQAVSPGTYKIVARTTDTSHAAVISTGRGTITLLDAPIVLENLQSGTELRYDTAYLAGTVKGNATQVVVERGGVESSWPIVSGRFKALVSLAPGNNEVNLTVGGIRQSVYLRYTVSTNRRFVRFVYMLSSDGDGQFDAPAGEPHDLPSAIARIKTAARLTQTLFAEKVNAQGLGRRTFRLETDGGGEPVVRVLRSSKTTAQLRALDGADLYDQFQTDLASQPSRADSIDVVISGVTHWNGTQSLGDGANYGPSQVMYGSSNLHTWAASLPEVVRRWSDVRVIDTTLLRDDGALRTTYWGNYATGLGVTQWMLATAFGLDGSKETTSLMYPRAFDRINRTFMMQEPANAPTGSSGLNPILPTQEIGLDKTSAIFLRFHRWMAPTDVAYSVNSPPSITTNGTTLSVSSSAGLRLVSYYGFVAQAITAHEEFLASPPSTFSATLASLKTRIPGESSIEVTAVDDQGNMARSTISLPP